MLFSIQLRRVAINSLGLNPDADVFLPQVTFFDRGNMIVARILNWEFTIPPFYYQWSPTPVLGPNGYPILDGFGNFTYAATLGRIANIIPPPDFELEYGITVVYSTGDHLNVNGCRLYTEMTPNFDSPYFNPTPPKSPTELSEAESLERKPLIQRGIPQLYQIMRPEFRMKNIRILLLLKRISQSFYLNLKHPPLTIL